MAMRETVKTLRIYFILNGVVGAVLSLFILASAVIVIQSLIGLGGLSFSIASLYLGIRLRTLLTTSPRTATSILLASMGWLGFLLVVDLLYSAVGPAAYTGLIILLFWYLLKNVRRLAAEQDVGSASLTGS